MSSEYSLKKFGGFVWVFSFVTFQNIFNFGNVRE